MSRPAAATGSGGAKRPAEEPTAAMDATAVQRPRLQSTDDGAEPMGAAAAPAQPFSSSASQSPAQRCATDTLGAVFSFLPFKELHVVLRVCRQWLAAASKQKPRVETFYSVDRLPSLCASRSPLRRHIRTFWNGVDSVSVSTLRGLAALPSLETLYVRPDAADLQRLVEQRGPQQALAELRDALPSRLRDLSLVVSASHSTAVCRLLLDALPAMSRLEEFTLASANGVPWPSSALLSLEPLLQLPRLTCLDWFVRELSASQAQTVKQMASLRRFDSIAGGWALEELTALCRPPHRLQQLEFLSLENTELGAEEMTELVRLPGLTDVSPCIFRPAAFPLLPRFPHLTELTLHPTTDLSDLSHEQHAAMAASLRACSSLTKLTLESGDPDSGELCVLTEEVGAQLVQCVPQLRVLRLSGLETPSLHFLRLAPGLIELDLVGCSEVASSHIMALSWWAPVLVRLYVRWCPGLRLDEFELQLLTPPSLALPRLQKSRFDPPAVRE